MYYKLSDCIKQKDGTIICWDCILHKLVKVSVEAINPSDVDADTLEKLLCTVIEKQKE